MLVGSWCSTSIQKTTLLVARLKLAAYVITIVTYAKLAMKL